MTLNSLLYNRMKRRDAKENEWCIDKNDKPIDDETTIMYLTGGGESILMLN